MDLHTILSHRGYLLDLVFDVGANLGDKTNSQLIWQAIRFWR